MFTSKGGRKMLSEKQFQYYTSQDFVIEPSFWKKLEGKLDKLEDQAQNTVENGQKIKNRSEFDSDAAYQVYLLNVNNYAWAKKLNAPLDDMITE